MSGRKGISIKQLKSRLLARREELLKVKEQVGNPHRAVDVDQSQVGRLNRIEAIAEQAKAIDADRRREAELANIEAALKRMEGGSYGYCVTCEEPIASRRLEQDPSAPQCINCARGNASG